MYVLFEQRERGLEGASFVEGAWDRFYRDLDALLAPQGLGHPQLGQQIEGGDPADEDDDDELDAGFDSGLETVPFERSGAA